MENYFADESRQLKLLDILNGWENVPYEHMGETKSGVDCSKLLSEVLMELGVFSGKQPGIYISPDWMIQSRDELLLNYIDQNIIKFLNPGLKFDVYMESFPELKFGDFLFFSLVKSGITCHSAIYVDEADELIFHARQKKCCMQETLSNSWKKRLTYIYRLKTWESQ